MQFMVSWRVHDDKRHEAMKHFVGMSNEEIAAETEGLELIGRWHDLIGFTGVAIVQARSAETLTSWLLKWNDFIDIEATPVFDDEAARKIGRKALV